jgi:flagellar basal body-associated protein FliL
MKKEKESRPMGDNEFRRKMNLTHNIMLILGIIMIVAAIIGAFYLLS